MSIAKIHPLEPTSVSQTAFRTALLDPRNAPPDGLLNPDGEPVEKRFAVYRNNVAHGLSEALLTGFPVLTKLPGEDFFREIAKVYLRIHPPTSPLMMHYGAALPTFLESFPGTFHLKYLPDVARLELGLRRAYHAKDAPVLDAHCLTDLDQPSLMGARLIMAPACEVLSTQWPAKTIWDFNMADGPQPQSSPEDILIARHGFDPERTPSCRPVSKFTQALPIWANGSPPCFCRRWPVLSLRPHWSGISGRRH